MAKELKPIREFRGTPSKYTRYIPILDENAAFAARYLTKEDAEKAYSLLKEVFDEIRAGEIFHVLMAETLLFSRENFLWYGAMLRELQKILEIDEKFNIPYHKAPEVHFEEVPVVYQPFHAGKNKRIHYYRALSKELHPINNYRIKYIMENYDMSEFFEDAYPAWYLLKETTVFEQYSEKTNTRVRVDFRDGEFSYFIAGASDNWQKIECVPIEMDHVVAALIFRSYGTDY